MRTLISLLMAMAPSLTGLAAPVALTEQATPIALKRLVDGVQVTVREGQMTVEVKRKDMSPLVIAFVAGDKPLATLALGPLARKTIHLDIPEGTREISIKSQGSQTTDGTLTLTLKPAIKPDADEARAAPPTRAPAAGKPREIVTATSTTKASSAPAKAAANPPLKRAAPTAVQGPAREVTIATTSADTKAQGAPVVITRVAAAPASAPVSVAPASPASAPAAAALEAEARHLKQLQEEQALAQDELVRAKAREYLDAMMRAGTLTGARFRLDIDNRVADVFELEGLKISTDDGVVVADAAKPASAAAAPAGEHLTIPGPTRFRVEARLRGRGFGAFAHLTDMVLSAKKDHVAVLSSGRSYVVHVRLTDKGSGALSDRPEISVEVKEAAR